MTPSVNDAVALLRDPANEAGAGSRAEFVAAGFIEMGGRVVTELRARGAESIEASLALVHGALEVLGGLDASYWMESSQIGGGRRTSRPQRVYAFRVPVGEIDQPQPS